MILAFHVPMCTGTSSATECETQWFGGSVVTHARASCRPNSGLDQTEIATTILKDWSKALRGTTLYAGAQKSVHFRIELDAVGVNPRCRPTSSDGSDTPRTKTM